MIEILAICGYLMIGFIIGSIYVRNSSNFESPGGLIITSVFFWPLAVLIWLFVKLEEKLSPAWRWYMRKLNAEPSNNSWYY